MLAVSWTVDLAGQRRRAENTRSSATIGASPPDQPAIRNVAIIAHVDHGKTTLGDKLMVGPAHSGSASRWLTAGV